MEVTVGGLAICLAIVWVPWVVVRLSWTDTFPITTWRDFIPMYDPEDKS